jgi:hypothetical protein
MNRGAPDPIFLGWDRLDWKERRERRFQRWLDARGVEFAGDAARQDYEKRVELLVDAIMLKKPERVPVSANVQFYTGAHSGLSKKEAMYEYEKMAAALVKFHEDFRPDFQAKPVSPAPVFEMLGLTFVDWPGRNLPDETPWQYRETEYMREDEYDALIADPEGYFRRALLPRFGTAFAPLAGLPPFTDFVEAAAMPYQVLGFGDPTVVEGMLGVADVAGEGLLGSTTTGAAAADAAGRLGIPPEWSGSAKAPYDILADTLRGTKGIMMDRFRRPEKILEAAERFVPLVIDHCVRQGAWAESPLIIFWLHKGSDSFMSWRPISAPSTGPTLKAVMKGVIEEGLVPYMFARAPTTGAWTSSPTPSCPTAASYGCSIRPTWPPRSAPWVVAPASPATFPPVSSPWESPTRCGGMSPSSSTPAPPTEASTCGTGAALDHAKAETWRP